MFTTLLRALSLLRIQFKIGHRPTAPRSFSPRLPAHKDRIATADLTWVGPVGDEWSEPANWCPTRLPRPSATVVFRPAPAPGADPSGGGEEKEQ